MGRFATPRPFLARLRRRAAGARAPRPAIVVALSLVAGAPSVAPLRAQAPTPEGGEFRVNSYTTWGQIHPSMAMDADGDFVVVWASGEQDGSSYGIYAQRYDAAGAAEGGEFRVNSYTTQSQRLPAVAMDADGDFVVAWTSYGQDGSVYGIYAQRYSASGAPQGDEFRVNSSTAQSQMGAKVAMDAGGDFVITWGSLQPDGVDWDVYAQRYDAAGVARGGEFRVNTYTTSDQHGPVVAMDADGDFVVVWQSYGQDGSGTGVYAQRYDAEGGAQGGELRVNTYTTSSQVLPAVAMDTDGDFVVVWTSEDRGSDGSADVFGQQFSAAGGALGGEFRLNTYATHHQRGPVVAMDTDGDFVVAWRSRHQDGDSYGVYARPYAAAGGPAGPEIRVNTHTTDYQGEPAVAVDADGDFGVAWWSDGQDGSYGGVYAQRYSASPVATEPGPGAGLALAVAPNPTTDGGRVRYAVAEAGPVRLSLHDVLGREVAVLVQGTVAAGAHEAALDASSLAPGAYVLRLTAGADVRTRRITVTR